MRAKDVLFSSDESVSHLRKLLRKHVKREQAGKRKILFGVENKESKLLEGKAFGGATLNETVIIAREHGLEVRGSKSCMKDSIIAHLVNGECATHGSFVGCSCIMEEYWEKTFQRSTSSNIEEALAGCILADVATKGGHSVVLRVLKCKNIVFDGKQPLTTLRKKVEKVGSAVPDQQEIGVGEDERARVIHKQEREKIQSEWPKIPSASFKEKLRRSFLDTTSSEALKEVACACCGELKLKKECQNMTLSDIDLDLLRKVQEHVKIQGTEQIKMPFTEGPLHDCYIEPRGVHIVEESAEIVLTFCLSC